MLYVKWISKIALHFIANKLIMSPKYAIRYNNIMQQVKILFENNF